MPFFTDRLRSYANTVQRSGAESPTTAKQLDFDDEHDAQSETQTTGVVKPMPASVEDEEHAAPPKPPRSNSPQQQAVHTLIEAFPSIDTKVIKAVLHASGGQVEPAFNALLGMSDPSFQADEAPPPMPPRPTGPQSQLEQDEAYARQLAQQYGSHDAGYYSGHGGQGRQAPRQRGSDNPDDRERSFFDGKSPMDRGECTI